MNNFLFYMLVSVVGILFLACNPGLNQTGETLTIDFSSQETSGAPSDTIADLRVAVAAMISPRETFVFYEDLFQYISDKTGSEIVFTQRKTYEEVNTLLKNNDVDLAFICSGAYATGHEESKMEILAIPIIGNRKHYQAYIIAHVNSGINHINDLQNKVFTFSDPLSHTGKLYIDKRLRELGHEQGFFSKTIYSNAHDVSMQLVSKRIVDGSSVKGTVYDYLEKFHPESVKNLKVIEKSEDYGMPPIVVPQGLDGQKKQQLKDLFLKMHLDPEGKIILENLLIDRFEEGNDADYNSIREINIVAHP